MRLNKDEAKKKYPNVNFVGNSFWIGERARIYEGARICEGAVNVKDCIVIHGIGNTKRITAYNSKKGVRIVIGCFEGNIQQAYNVINKKYPDVNHPYHSALAMIERHYKLFDVVRK